MVKRKNNKRRNQQILVGSLFVLFLIGLFIRLPQTGYGLPAARFPDGVKTVGVATRLSSDWFMRRFSLDPKFYQYPTLYAYTLAVCLYLGEGRLDAEQAGRTLSMAAGLGTAVVLFFIGYSLGGVAVGVLSFLFSCFGFLFIVQGRYPRTDPVQLFFLCLSLYRLVRNKVPTREDILWSGLWTGLAVGTKYVAFMPLVLVAVFILLPKKKYKEIGLWGAMSVGGFLLSTPIFVLKAKDFVSRLFWELKIQGHGLIPPMKTNLLSYLFSQDVVPPMTPFANSIVGTMGWPFVLMGVGGVGWFLWKERNNKDHRLFALAATALITYLYFSLSSKIQAIRFVLPVVALFVVIGAIAIKKLSRHYSKKFNPQVILGGLALLVLIPNFHLTKKYLNYLKEPDSRLRASLWIYHNIPSGDRVLNFMHGPALQPGRYHLLKGTMPQYAFQFKDRLIPGPRLSALKQSKVSWVILNSFYVDRYLNAKPEGLGANFIKNWQDFYAQLERKAVFEGSLSPKIEIFYVPPSVS